MSERQSNTGFLERWSTRKRQTEQDDSANDAMPVEQASVDQADVSSMPKDLSIDTPSEPLALDQAQIEPPPLTDKDMPAIESLTSESDLSGFFSKGVSSALKKAALRHVFQQAQFNVRDGLNDYDGDYTVFEPLGDTVTSDMKWHIARKERERLEAEARELELQERLELEQQSAENQNHESAVGDESEASQDVQEQEEVAVCETEHDDAVEQVVILEQEESILPDSAEAAIAVVNTQALAPRRVSGKLTRTERKDVQNDNKNVQLADAEQDEKENAQDQEQ